jgi:hypothetical protein
MSAFENQCSEMSKAELTQMLGDAFDRSRALEDRITDLQARNSELVTQRRAWQRVAETLAGGLLKVQVGDGGGAAVLALAHFCAAIEEP